MPKQITTLNMCTGCKMCGDLCSKKAITYKINKNGFWYPEVDQDKCIECGQCIKKCPINYYKNNFQTPTVYAAWSKSDEIRVRSTSGGIYYELAAEVIKNGGYIVGCKFTDDYRGAFHCIGSNWEDLDAIMNSKYFQSDTNGIYKATSEILKSGRQVLFCGAPCQIAALNNYLGGEKDNLLTCDFICRGINSPLAYNKFLDELEIQYSSKVKHVHFKDKRNGWQKLTTSVQFENQKEFAKSGKEDHWITSFANASLCIREACGNCKFKGTPRIADISLGDFWGVKGFSEEDYQKGISIVIVNSEKGRKLFGDIDTIFREKRDLEQAHVCNPCINQSVRVNDYSMDFFNAINRGISFSEAVKRYANKKGIKHYIYAIRRKIKNR
jgi:Coenzyme F420-reducing hydrogenase, beta subunit